MGGTAIRAFAFLMIWGLAGIASAVDPPARLSTDREILLDSPDGTPIGQLDRGTEVRVVGEAGTWAKVVVYGWVPKASLATDTDADAAQEHPAGNGFAYSHLVLTPRILGTQIQGQVTNFTGRAWVSVSFVLTAEGQDGAPLDSTYVTLNDLAPESKTDFKACLLTTRKDDIARLELRYQSGR